MGYFSMNVNIQIVSREKNIKLFESFYTLHDDYYMKQNEEMIKLTHWDFKTYYFLAAGTKV